MAYQSLEACLLDLEKHGHLVRVKEEVDPYLQLASVHLRIHAKGGPALLFEKVKGSSYRAASNIFGTIERSRFIFRDTLKKVQQLISLRDKPFAALKDPVSNFSAVLNGVHALPLANPFSKPVLFKEISVSILPLITHWPEDGGAFITLPQVYTEDADKPGIMNANVGMYRIQLNGNEYELNREVGLHYQLHRGIGIHQQKAKKNGRPLKVSIFVGGPPAHSVAAVMPLPEGMSELTFAGLLGGRRFRYKYVDGFCISTDADFVITGEVYDDVKPEGPFGDHLGYYSLAHNFPVMKVHKVYAKENAIWPFTVVGRPPQEDTSFGQLIHELTGEVLQKEIPGLKQVNAVDAAGVHPLLLAIGSERYTPYDPVKRPAEILTIANHILGTGQLSLAKFLWITADDSGKLDTHDIPNFFSFILQRIDLKRDIHFYTNTTIDTLDYSGTGLNSGSKVVFAAYGDVIRELINNVPEALRIPGGSDEVYMVMPGIAALKAPRYVSSQETEAYIQQLDEKLQPYSEQLSGLPLIILTEDPQFLSASINNFLWVAFTRCNPSHDIFGVASETVNKHWGCSGPLLLDARIKPHHAPPLVTDPVTESMTDALFEKGGSLYNFR